MRPFPRRRVAISAGNHARLKSKGKIRRRLFRVAGRGRFQLCLPPRAGRKRGGRTALSVATRLGAASQAWR